MDINISKAKKEDYPFFFKLYTASFPEEERRDYSLEGDLQRFIESHQEFTLYIIKNKNERAGFITIWDLGEFLYGEHLATLPEIRGKGTGAAVLEEVKRIADERGKGFLLEVEMPENEMSRRRIGFYERNGFTLHPDYKYIQPPYRAGLPEVEMLLMTYGNLTPTPEYIAHLHHKVYKRP